MIPSGKTAESILLVDDEEDIRDVLQLALSDLGLTVHQAENGDQAMALFKQYHPPLVLTDIKMPVMDGIELLQRVKHENPDTEVIMITGHGDMDLAIKSLKHEATDFITKPINVDALEISIKRARDRILVRDKLRQYTENLEILLKEKTELQDRLASLGLMISSMAHGVKGLLTGLDAGAYLLDTGVRQKDDTRISEGWQTVKGGIGKIRNLIQDILFYSKKRDVKMSMIPVAVFAHEIASEFRKKMNLEKCRFVFESGEDLGRFQADSEYLQTALVNILDNAADACAKDSVKAAHTIRFRASRDRKSVIFTIRDDGIGMDTETQRRIFTLFFSSKGPQGTGLGLFIAKSIVAQHGGVIDVKSSPGQGSRFRIRIPVNR
ncbi:MAG: response regulator [Desulfobacteraceae bacterium]|nr:response regulator [Desulfobacteraceae bacterium]